MPKGYYPRKRRDTGDRFWEKVDKTDTCWLWRAGKSTDGYGTFEGRVAHRFSYQALVGEIPEGLELDHLCRVRHCVNPAHLEPVTPYENMLRGFGCQAVNARKTHCVNGHLLAGSNLGGASTTRRNCKECWRAATARYKTRKAEIGSGGSR